jgi:predicted small metal-binding protein
MSRQVKCECGYIARADTDEEVLAKIRDHLGTDHPQLAGAVTDDDIRGWIEIVA